MSQDETEYEVMDVQDVAFLKVRIRELEQKTGHQHSQIYILDERIAKAREILSHSMSESREFLLIQIGKALEALEGK